MRSFYYIYNSITIDQIDTKDLEKLFYLINNPQNNPQNIMYDTNKKN